MHSVPAGAPQLISKASTVDLSGPLPEPGCQGDRTVKARRALSYLQVNSAVCSQLNVMLRALKSFDELHNRGAKGCETTAIAARKISVC